VRRIGFVILATAALIAVDRGTKLFFEQQPQPCGLFSVPGIIECTHHQNYGILANLPVPQFVIILLTFIALGVLGALLRRAITEHATHRSIALAAVIAGAIGNLWDRIVQGYVFDWLLLGGRSVINVADICIALGLLAYILTPRSDRKHLDSVPKTP